MFVLMGIYVMVLGAHRVQGRAQIPEAGIIGGLWPTMWILGTELKSSERISTLNCWAISLAPETLFFILLDNFWSLFYFTFSFNFVVLGFEPSLVHGRQVFYSRTTTPGPKFHFRERERELSLYNQKELIKGIGKGDWRGNCREPHTAVTDVSQIAVGGMGVESVATDGLTMWECQMLGNQEQAGVSWGMRSLWTAFLWPEWSDWRDGSRSKGTDKLSSILRTFKVKGEKGQNCSLTPPPPQSIHVK